MKVLNMVRNHIKKCKERQRFNRDCRIYSNLNRDRNFRLDAGCLMPVYEDKEQAGRLDEHYFLQDIWMARQVRMNGAQNHYDVGSRVDGFIAHLLSMDVGVTLIDIRRLAVDVEKLSFVQGDATNLASIADGTISSLSSLHAVEHFGLGRYGDSIDPDAWRKVLHSFERVLEKDGYLYLSVPIGERNHIIYNAHRIFCPLTIINELKGMSLIKFSYIENYKIYEVENFDKIIDNMVGKDYLCGCFVFRKM